MKRRSVLAAIGGGLCAVGGCSTATRDEREASPTAASATETSTPPDLGACSDDGSWPPTVSVPDVVLAPGDRTTFELRAGPLESFRFDGDLYKCGADDGPVGFGDVAIEPDPEKQADSCPPVWLWDECQTVTLRISVEATSDAEPGEYEFGFSVSDGHAGGRASEFVATLVVSES